MKNTLDFDNYCTVCGEWYEDLKPVKNKNNPQIRDRICPDCKHNDLDIITGSTSDDIDIIPRFYELVNGQTKYEQKIKDGIQ